MKYIVPDGDRWLYWDGQNKNYYDTKVEAEKAMEQSAIGIYVNRLLDLKAGISGKYDDARTLTRFGEDSEAVDAILAMPIADADGNLLLIPNTSAKVVDIQKLIATLQAIETLMETVLATTGEAPRKTLGRLIGGK